MLKDYNVNGIQQIGIGVSNLREAWKCYISLFGMDCRIFEDEAEARLMLPYTGGKPRSRHAVLAINLQSGGGFEVWQYKGREPLPPAQEILLGDLGILGCKIKVRNTGSSYTCFKQKGANLLGEPVADPSGHATYFLMDPFGNLFQMVEASDWFVNENKQTGGSYGALIGVSDIGRAIAFYSDILGYDRVTYDTTGVFPDLSNVAGGRSVFRRVLLERSGHVKGPFSKVFGKSVIELIQSVNRPGRKIFEGRFWGDLGFIHLCFDIHGMDRLREYCNSIGYPFTVDSKKSHDGKSFDMGEAAGHFAYIEDPDGTLIELVETHRVPILKKLGLYLDLTRRDPRESLPDWIVKLLRFSKVKLK